MTAADAILKMVLAYNAPLEIQTVINGEPRNIPNPRIEMLAEWFKQFQEGDETRRMFNLVLNRWKPYGQTLPLPVDLNAIMDEENSVERDAEKAWNELARYVSATMSVLIVNPVAQECVYSMGGWDKFVCRRDDDPKWTHKEFIDLYRLHSKSNGIMPRVLRGHFDLTYNSVIDYDKVRIIGNREQGMMMLESIKSGAELPGIDTSKIFKRIE